MSYTELKVGGVPEHFNLPWHLAIENESFENIGISVKWKDYPGGTGAMCADLRSGELDIAILLTEGLLADIIKGNPSKIIQCYVKTPLIWGIHVPTHSNFQNMNDVQGKRYAISRFGSGSHLMAHVDAKMREWNLKDDQFVVVNNLEGARESFKNNKADIFMWEKYMTKPLVDNGEFRRIDECPTPWPCFMIAASDKALDKYREEIKKLQAVINSSCEQLMKQDNASAIIASRYKLQENDVKQWLKQTSWSINNTVEKNMLDEVMDSLLKLKIVDTKIQAEAICSDLCDLK